MTVRAAPPRASARRLEVLAVGIGSDQDRHHLGLLVEQTRAIVPGATLPLRPPAPADGAPAPAVLYEGAWLPMLDLAVALGLAAGGRVPAVRAYFVIVQVPPGPRLALGVDTVLEIGVCQLDQVLPVPTWLRRQLHPALIWAAIDPADLTSAQHGQLSGLPPGPGGPAPLILLLDCAALPLPPGVGE